MNQSFNTVLCQSCGAANKDTDEKCAACGAPLPGRLMEKQEQQAKEKLLASLPELSAQKIRELEEELAKRPDATALLIQLSNLYKDHGIKDMAVQYMEQAVSIDPSNKFLQQKLRIMVDGEQDQSEMLQSIRQRETQTRKGSKFVGIGLGVVALVIALFVLKIFLFPDAVRIAKGGKDTDAVSPQFSSDSTKIAYLEAPRFTIFGVLDSLESTKGSVEEIKIMVKPIKGDARQILDAGAKNISLTTFDWRPRHDEISFSGWTLTDDLGGGHIIYLLSDTGGEPKKIADGSDYAWSPDGARLAYVKDSWMDPSQGGLFVLHLESEIKQHVSALDCSHPSWSPDGQDLIFQGRDRGKLMDAAKSLIAGEISPETEDLFAKYVGDIYRYDTNTGQVTQITTDGTFRSPQYTPDGSKIAALQYADTNTFTNTLVTMDSDGSSLTTLLAPGDEYVYFGEFDLSPDGKKVAFEGFFESEGAPASPQVDTPLGMMGGEVNYVSDIFTVNSDGSEVKRLKSGRHKYKKNPVFSPDGKMLAYEIMYLDLGRDIWAMKR